MRLEITLKSGTTISADVTKWKYSKTELSWTTPERSKRRLVTVDFHEIAAIVEVR